MWVLFLYRLPSEPSRARVAVWRELRRLGALPLSQGVVAVPDTSRYTSTLDQVGERITRENGSFYRFRLTDLDGEQGQRLESEWNALREHEYAEIVGECETKFLKEIEFEIFRDNLTASEAEEIEADLDKLQRWFQRVDERDEFGAKGRTKAERAIATCAKALEDFVERVYQAEAHRGSAILDAPRDLPWGETGKKP